MDCKLCYRKNTKYKCTVCGSPICNVCAESVDDDDDSYDEVNHRVGRCPGGKCASLENVGDVEVEVVGEAVVDEETTAGNKILVGNDKPQSQSGKQTTISNFFTKPATATNKTRKRKVSDTESKNGIEVPEPKPKQICKNINEGKNEGGRQIKVETIENNWKNKLATLDVNEWLSYEKQTVYAVDLKCLVCTKFEQNIKHMKGFSRKWITGCQNYKVSAAREHGESEPHKHAMKCHHKSENPNYIEEKDADQLSLPASFMAGDERTASQVKKKFEVAYFAAKEEMAFLKYPAILKLEEMHGVDIGQAYRNDKNCAEFIDYIGQDLQNNLSAKLKNANFCSILFDGSTDHSVKEQEGFYVLLFDPQPVGKPDKVEVKMNFLGIQSTKASEGGATAVGIKHGIKKCFEDAGLEKYAEKLIGFCSDGANVNKGNKTGVMAEMKGESPWLVFIWCMAHRLELAIKESLEGTKFNDIDGMLLNIYLLYEKSSKKLSQLGELCEKLRDSYEFTNGGLKPIRSCGTRWIAHKINAMRVLIDKFGLYMQHLEEMSDRSYKSDQRAKIKGYLAKWKQTNMLLNMAFYLDLLQPVSYLSLAFQKEDIDPVRAIEALLSIRKRLQKLKSKSVYEFSHLADIKKKATINEDGHFVYQGMILKQMDRVMENISKKKGREVTAIDDIINVRLKGEYP